MGISATKQALSHKIAELDALDGEITELDSTMPVGDTGGSAKFDLLAEKREELEKEIRSMRERVQLITEWEKFKSGDWSEDVKADLNNLDQQFTDIAGGDSGGMGDPMAAPVDLLAPAAPAALPPADDPLDVVVPEEDSMGMDNSLVGQESPEAETIQPPLAPTMASKKSQVNEKKNYQPQGRTGNLRPTSKKGDITMANPTKPSLIEKLAEVKTKREAITKEAKTRVAAAWTIAKTMLPTAPVEFQKAFASNLLQNKTSVLKATLRQTAINSHYTKIALEAKKTLNEGAEGEDKAATAAIKKEMSGKPINAATKVADDTKECGKQPAKYDDGRAGSDTKGDLSKIDAGKAGDRDADTVNKSEGEKKASAKKAAACEGADCKGCENCSKTAAPEDTPPAAPPAEAPMPPAPEAAEAPAEDGGMPPMDEGALPEEGAPEATGQDLKVEGDTEIIKEKVDEALGAIKSLETELLGEQNEEPDFGGVMDGEELEGEGDELMGEGDELMGEGDELEATGDELEGEGEEVAEEGKELDFDQMFNDGNLEEKKSALANEDEDGDSVTASGGEDFEPTNLEASMADHYANDMQSIFSMQGADGDPLASLMGSLKTAQEVAGMELIPSSTGEAANHFENEETEAETRDTESDHMGDLWADAIEDITPEEQGAKRLPQDSKPKLEAPKSSATLKRIKPIVASDKKVKTVDLGEMLFNNDEY